MHRPHQRQDPLHARWHRRRLLHTVLLQGCHLRAQGGGHGHRRRPRRAATPVADRRLWERRGPHAHWPQDHRRQGRGDRARQQGVRFQAGAGCRCCEDRQSSAELLEQMVGFGSLAPKTKNLVVGGGLTGFVFGVYYYTMRAVSNTDELQVAIDKLKELKKRDDAATPAANPSTPGSS